MNVTMFGCAGGGFQSKALTQYIADLLQKKVYVQEGYHQASVVGAAVICNENLSINGEDVSKCPGDRTEGLSDRIGFI